MCGKWNTNLIIKNMSNQEKLELIQSNPGCWIYSKSDVILNTAAFLRHCKTRENFDLSVVRYSKNSCSTYFSNYYRWYIRDENCNDCSCTYSRFDNEDTDGLLKYVERIVLIESSDHKVLWAEKEVDGKILIGKFLFSEEFLHEILVQQSLFQSQFGDEPTSIRLNGRIYSKEELESILEQIDSLRKILNK